MDPRVLEVQQWLNSTYSTGASDFPPVPENGRTGWTTVYGLTRGLQIELGISPTSDNFGPTTMSRCPTVSSTSSNASANIVRIIQGGLLAKGYNPGPFDGKFGSGTTAALETLQQDAAISVDGIVTPQLMRALCTMDTFVLVPGGETRIRDMQRFLNANYADEAGIGPADGAFSRTTNTALIIGLQVEIGIADPNGNFGPATQAGLPVVKTGSSVASNFVRMIQFGLYLNGFPGGGFTGVFDASTRDAVVAFQAFHALAADGVVGRQSWMALLISRGDPSRSAKALDCSDELTSDRIALAKNAGYQIVGRYIWQSRPIRPNSFNKVVRPGELGRIVAAGLRYFPIFQAVGNGAQYFNASFGRRDAGRALTGARQNGVPEGATIYFGVDFDVLDQDISSHIIPYFSAVADEFAESPHDYRIGMYGPRKACREVAAAVGAVRYSFVSDMSSGFTGNIGQPLPSNWAFDQFANISLGSGAAQFEIDKVAVSGRDPGVSSVLPGLNPQLVDREHSSALRAEYEPQIVSWLTENFTTLQMAKKNRPIATSVADILDLDAEVTFAATRFPMSKSLLQTVLLWEHAVEGVDDLVADAAVMQTYRFKEYLEDPITNPPVDPPAIEREDSSTGYGQMFARVWILAHNWAVGRGLISGNTLDRLDWHVIWGEWQKIHNDPTFNARAASVILLWGGSDIDGESFVDGLELPLPRSQAQKLLARYNGEGDAAAAYGENKAELFAILEDWNSRERS